MKPSVLTETLRAGGHGLCVVDYNNPDNHVPNESLVIGFVTRQTISKLLEEGDISSHQYVKFFNAAKAFLIRATEYLLKWYPLQDELLKHATWLDFEERLEKSFDSVEFFVHSYPNLFPHMDINRLNEQFLNYQLLSADEIPLSVKETAGLSEENPHCVGSLWGYLRNVRKPGSSAHKFDLLFKVAEVVMTIPHSNAGEERIFSYINKNKTPSTSSLKLDGMLSTLLLVKTHIENPLNWEPTKELVVKAKKATKLYNANTSCVCPVNCITDIHFYCVLQLMIFINMLIIFIFNYYKC